MLKKQPANVFPLHLAPLDAFFCADDTPRHPMTSVIHLDFEGRMDREAFDEALEEALVRHPLLRALIRPAKGGRPCWVSAGSQRPLVDWGGWEEGIQCPAGEGIDLGTEVGLRFWIRRNEHSTRMTVQVHHACTDGTGVYRFLGDLLALYGLIVGGDGPLPELATTDLRLLRGRRARMAEHALAGGMSRFVAGGLREAAHIFGKRIEPLAAPRPPRSDGRPATPFPGICTTVFSTTQYSQLRLVAARYGGMVNDLLLAEMFRTIATWNDSLGLRSSRRWLRIMMPADLREIQDYQMPAANMTAYTFLTRRRDACRDFGALLRSVCHDTGQIKCHRRGARFVDALVLSTYAPSVLPFLLRRDRCIATATLSNLGDPTRRFTARFPRCDGRIVCGNLVLEQVSGVPPLRHHTHVTLAIFAYRRRMTICVRCDPYQFTAEEAQRLLDMYRTGLLSHLTEATIST